MANGTRLGNGNISVSNSSHLSDGRPEINNVMKCSVATDALKTFVLKWQVKRICSNSEDIVILYILYTGESPFYLKNQIQV